MDTKSVIDLSIIIPAYNEADIINANLRKLADFLNSRKFGEVEVVVVSNCPADTAQAALKCVGLFKHFRLVDEKSRIGKGGAVRLGMFEARGRYRLFMDTDLATPLTHLDAVFKHMQSNTQVAIGVRDLVKIHKGIMRKLITKTANLAAQILVIPGIKDTQCGFKLFEASVAQNVFSRQIVTGWSFDIELLAIARYLGYSIKTIEILDWKDPKSVGLVGDSPLKIVLTEAIVLFKIRWRLWTGRYRHPTYVHRADAVPVAYKSD